jgi:subtilase family serine protease
MTRRLPLAAAIAVVATGLAVVPMTTPAGAAPVRGEQRVCSSAPAGYAACHAHVRTLKGRDGVMRPDATSGPTGFTAAQLKTAYGLTDLDGTTTIAVVDAYAHPNALADLNAYRSAMGLGPANLTQYNQTGGSTLPGADVGWGQEEMLDLEMVSAICPSCPIIYVGGNSASFADLGKAVDTAVAKGAKVVSNSYGAPEFRGETTYAASYNHPGVAMTVSSGDSGSGVQVPAAFNTVTAVGGTHLVLDSTSHRASETVWTGAGSGCSAYVTRPSWQPATSKCNRRAVADVSAVADPATGVAVYDSYGSSGGLNWYVFGGTSVAAPIIGGIYGLTGASTAGIPAKLSYDNRSALFDVTSGTTTSRCRAGYLCSGVVGYDGPTGNGTPNGSLTPF